MADKVLVTGGSGFLSSHIIYQLLKKDYQVKATLRNLDKKDGIIKNLTNHGISNIENLSFVKADLMSDENWDEAMKYCKYVLSVASPLFESCDGDNMDTSTKGTLRVLSFAQKNNINRVVMTSNFGAVGFSNFDENVETTEEFWTKENQDGLSDYEKSKLMAEKAAWKYMEESNSEMEFATVNPVAILGPSMDGHISSSYGLLTNLLSGRPMPNLELNLVDVRDVADIHIRVMETPEAANNRFIASADGKISMKEIAELIKEKRPTTASKVSTRMIPTKVIDFAGKFNPLAKEGSLMLHINRNVSNYKAKDMLNWTPINNNEEIVLDSIDTLVKYDLIDK